MASYEELEEKTKLNEKLMLKNFRKNAIHSFIKGRYTKEYKEVLDYYRERYREELQLYKDLLDYLKMYYFSNNREEAEKLINKVLNRYQDTFDYYYIISDMNVLQHEMCGMIHEEIEKDQNLIDEVHGVSLTERDVINYFRNYEGTYFVSEHVHHIDGGDDLSWYGVFLKTDDSILRSFKLFIPKVTNLQTAKIAVKEYKQALDLYDLIGQELKQEDNFETMIVKDGKTIEESANDEVNRFIKSYVRNK